MNLKGSHVFQAPRSAVWDALLDPQVLGRALPGGDRLERVSENEYRAAMNVKVGPVQGKFEGKVELTDLEPGRGYRMQVNGEGTPGFVNGEGTIYLADDGDGSGTLLTYEGTVQVGGRIASVGQRLLDSTAKSIIRQGLKTLDEHLLQQMAPPAPQEPEPVSAPAEPAPSPMTSPTPSAEIGASKTEAPASTPAPAAAPSSAPSADAAAAARMTLAVVKDVAQDLASDYIPREKQERVLYMFLGAMAMLLFVVLVRTVQKQ
jgi:carbon monoxide dehydrogenase subunit G